MEFRARQVDVSPWGDSCRRMYPPYMYVVPFEARTDGACIDEIPETFDAARLCGSNALIPPRGACPPGREKCNRETGYNSINACGCCRAPACLGDCSQKEQVVVMTPEQMLRYQPRPSQRNTYMWWVIALLLLIVVSVGLCKK